MKKRVFLITKNIVLGTLLLVFILWLGHFARENEFIQNEVARFGYGGVLITSLVAGFNFIAPVPAISFLPLFLESGLSFWPTILIIILGTTIADSTAYFIGHSARQIAMNTPEQKIYRFLMHFKAHRWIMLTSLFFFAAFAPLPNELIVVPMGFLGYRLRNMFPLLLLGNALFNLILGAGLQGIF